MKDTKFIRQGKSIQDIRDPDDVSTFDHHGSVNAAKRASRKIQMKKDGALGRGTLIAR